MSEDLRLTGLVGYSGMKIPVDLCATANITLSGEQSIDGVTTSASRILLTGQTDQTKNGIWITDSGDWSRASDCDGPYDLRQGSSVFVYGGTSNSGYWYCTTANTVDIGTDNITWARASSVLAAINAFWQATLGTTTATAAFSALAAEAMTAGGIITPTTLAANTDDWAPTGFSTASMVRASASAAYNLTGIAGGAAGRMIMLHNVGSYAITLKNDTTSTAANRFALSADYTLGAAQSVLLEYDGTTSRWRIFGQQTAASSIYPRLLTNVGLSVSMAGNAVTVALKGADGSDPSPSNIVEIGFRNATLTNGQSSKVQVTAATSAAISSTSTMGTVSGEASRIWVGAILVAGAVELALFQSRSGTSIAPINEGGLISTTAEGGAGAADSAQTWYSTTARASVPVTILGYFDSTQATAGTWASAASAVVVNPQYRPGDTVQSFRAESSATGSGTTAIPYDNSVPAATEGNAIAALDITATPTSAANIVERTANVNTTRATAANVAAVFLHKDGGAAEAIAIETDVASATIPSSKVVRCRGLAGSASSTAYHVRYGGDGTNTVYLNQNSGATNLFGASFLSWHEMREIMV